MCSILTVLSEPKLKLCSKCLFIFNFGKNETFTAIISCVLQLDVIVVSVTVLHLSHVQHNFRDIENICIVLF